MKRLFTCILLLSCVFIFKSTVAQENTPKPKFMVWEVMVNPMQMDKLMDAIQFQHQYLKEQNYPFEGFVQYTNDGYFWYSTGFQNYSDIDKMNAADEKLWSSNDKKLEEIQKKFEGAYNSIGSFILELQPELSIMPPQQDAAPTGTKFRYFETFYLKQGKQQEIEEAIKKYIALRKKYGYDAAMYTLYPRFDDNLSVLYFIDELGNNAADYYTKNQEKWAKFGEEGEQLWDEVKPLLERIESHSGWANYDVSYFPEN